jgi:hypothetical protein
MEKISWTDRVRYEVLHRVKEEEYPTNNKKDRLTELITTCVKTAFLKQFIEREIKGGKDLKWLEDDEKDVSSYWIALR